MKRWDRMTREEREAASAEIAYREAREQGLSEKIEDPAFYARLARIFRNQPQGRAS